MILMRPSMTNAYALNVPAFVPVADGNATVSGRVKARLFGVLGLVQTLGLGGPRRVAYVPIPAGLSAVKQRTVPPSSYERSP